MAIILECYQTTRLASMEILHYPAILGFLSVTCIFISKFTEFIEKSVNILMKYTWTF